MMERLASLENEDTRLLRTHSDPEEGGGQCGSPLPTPSPGRRRKSYIPGLGTTSSKFASVVEDTIKLNGAAHPVKEVR